MDKNDIKKCTAALGIRQWQIAEKIGMREDSFSRMLRHGLSQQYEDKVKHAIAEILAEKGGEHGTCIHDEAAAGE